MTESEPARAADASRTERAFDHFYREHLGELHRALTLAIGSSDLAREAVDEAMARAYARWRTVGTYDRPAAWVYRVALNWSTSRFRKRRRETLDPFLPGSPREAGVADPVAADPELARALAALSVDHRSVVVLRYLLDWSEAETAQALGVATGTVKSRLNRALARLAHELGGRSPDGTDRPDPNDPDDPDDPNVTTTPGGGPR